jgi:hypothetical protein
LEKNSPQILQLVEKLINARLLIAQDVAGSPLITLAQDLLIQDWPVLRDWLERSRAQLQRIPRLLLVLAASEPEDRLYAADAIGRLGSAASEAAPALISRLQDSSVEVRQRAVDALARIGPAALAAATPALLIALTDQDERVRRSAKSALEQINSPTDRIEEVDVAERRHINEFDRAERRDLRRSANTAERRTLFDIQPTAAVDFLERVILYADSWNSHITIAHPELRGQLSSVEETIRNPSAIYISNSVSGSYIFEREGVLDAYGRHLRVVVKPIGRVGFVPTAYFTSAPGGRQIWP